MRIYLACTLSALLSGCHLIYPFEVDGRQHDTGVRIADSGQADHGPADLGPSDLPTEEVSRDSEPDRPALPCELAEAKVALWAGWCNKDPAPCAGGVPVKAMQISFEPHSYAPQPGPGQGATLVSVRAACTLAPPGSFGDLVRIGRPAGKLWDLGQLDRLVFSAFTKSISTSGWNSNPCTGDADRVVPWIIVVDSAGRTVRAHNPALDFNPSTKNWMTLVVPIKQPANGWKLQADPAFDYASVKAIEVHLDAWGDTYELLIDGLEFTDSAGKPFTQCG